MRTRTYTHMHTHTRVHTCWQADRRMHTRIHTCSQSVVWVCAPVCSHTIRGLGLCPCMQSHNPWLGCVPLYAVTQSVAWVCAPVCSRTIRGLGVCPCMQSHNPWFGCVPLYVPYVGMYDAAPAAIPPCVLVSRCVVIWPWQPCRPPHGPQPQDSPGQAAGRY